MKSSDVGIITYFQVGNTIRSIPTKSFEYMANLLPMVMSNFVYWQKMFKGCALFVNPYDSKDIAKKYYIF